MIKSIPKRGGLASAQVLEIYKVLVEMADRVSQRRQANNNFYLTVNTAIVGASAYLSTARLGWLAVCVISVSGVVICATWGWSIQSYRTLNRAKFAVIHDVEKLLPVKAFTKEWANLTGGGTLRHTPFHAVEVVVPVIFGLMHAIFLVVHIYNALVSWKFFVYVFHI